MNLSRATAALPEWMRSARWRITFLYSTVLFLVAALLLGALYFSLHASLKDEHVSNRYRGAVVVFPSSVNEEPQVFVNVSDFERQVDKHALATLRSFSFGALGALFLISLGVGWVISGRVLQPIDRIAGVAERIQATDLSQRIDLEGPDDELKRLADTFDRMLTRLDDAFAAQRRFIADASHELRNPLAIIRTNLDVDLADPHADADRLRHTATVVRRATERMSRLVDDLLALARLDAPGALTEAVDISAVAGEVVDEYDAVAADHGVLLHRAIDPGVEAEGDAQAVKRAVVNLVDNAIRFSPRGAPVTVAVGTSRGWAFVAVDDRGPGIRPEDRERVFDRFWRARRARPDDYEGSGLGLPIVRQIVESHGGSVRLASRLGEGSTFVLWLPLRGARKRSAAPPEQSPLAGVVTS